MRFRLLCLVLLIGCGKVEDKPPPGDDCTMNSECTDPALPFCIGGACNANCAESTDCVDPGAPVCASDGACVGCESATDCTGATAPVCDTDTRECRGCSADAECVSGVCVEAEGGCVADADVAFVADMGIDNNECTRAAPCATITAAISKTNKRVIKVLGGTLDVFNDPITINGDRVLDGSDTSLRSNATAITIIEPSTAIVEGFRVTVPTDPTIPAIRSSGFGANPILHDITVVPGQGGFGIHATNGSLLTLQHSRIGALGSATTEVQCQNAKVRIDQNRFESAFFSPGTGACEGTVTRNRFESNNDRSVHVLGGPMVIENNLIIHNNGFNDSILAINMRPGSTIRFNTLINTTAVPSDGAALSCDNTVEVTSNVFAYNSGHPITGQGCATRFSIFDDVSVTSAGTGNQTTGIETIFVNRAAGDFHLAPTSIARAGAEPGQIMVKVDFEGNPRPNPAGTTSDCGAFEAP
jgi:hypothetical protein